MKCQNAEKILISKTTEELSPIKAKALRVHLRECNSCRPLQQALGEAQKAFQPKDEPSTKTLQNVLREARLNAPKKKSLHLWGLKPAMTLLVALIIGWSIFFVSTPSNPIGLELIMIETQLMESEDQIASVMYGGLSEDNLAFNFFMTYEEG